MRRISHALLPFVFSALLFPQSSNAQTSKPTLFYIPHTHWEGAVFKTREEYLEMGLPNILKALAMLKAHPEFKFTLDQAAYVKPFLERYPEEAAAFKKFVAEGRLEMVGGMDVMPDVSKPGGELFVRQMQYGKRYFKENLGVDTKVAWLVDTFGHHPQMPQLLRQAGFTSFWFCRGVPNNKIDSEFLWRGIDGTDISAIWLPGFYGLFYGPPDKPADFANFFKARYDSLNPNTRANERVGLSGVDVSEPEAYVPPLIQGFNQNPDRPFTIRYSVPSEYAAVVEKRANRPVINGDFNPIFQGTYSSRIELKQRAREIEQKLLTAEKLGVVSGLLGAPIAEETFMQAWEPTLFNQTHDLASGVMTDHVYEDVQRAYDFSSKMADELASNSWERLVSRINTLGDGIPVTVFNTLAWNRTDIGEVEVGFADHGFTAVEVHDSNGKVVPSQIARADKYEDGSIKRAYVVFIARDLPSLGYTVYHVLPQKGSAGSNPQPADSDTIENEFYRVRFDMKNGAIISIFDKKQNWEVLSGPANVISRLEDKGDLWEPYHGLDGASHIAMTTKQPVPTSATAKLSTSYSDKPGTILRGPVFSEFSISHPLDTGSFATRVRLYSGSRRIDIETQLTNKEKGVRYHAIFPTSVKQGVNTQEIPFGAVERPIGVEYPAQQWVDYSGERRGLTVLNSGMPGNVVNDGTMMLSLLRSHTIGGYGFGGGYEPGMSSDTGLELNVPRSFHYALVPHAGDWSQASVYKDGWEFNHPLVVKKTASHAGTLAANWGLIGVSHPNVVVTAVRPGLDGTAAIRLYEASGKSTSDVRLSLKTDVTSAWESDLLEKPGQKMKVENNAVQFSLHPFEIKTILVKMPQMKIK